MMDGDKHLVFYDGECGLCDNVVQVLLKNDVQENFLFAPLKGLTASEYLRDLPEQLKSRDSIILVENYQLWNRRMYLGSTAVFRICWLLDGWWKIPGWLFFLPSFLFDWIYRIVARYRHLFFEQKCIVPSEEQKKRFLR